MVIISMYYVLYIYVYTHTLVSVGLAGLCSNLGACVTIRAIHILMGRERTEAQALPVASNVFSSGIVSASFSSTGGQA